ncbi:MAG: efflux RND transporter periplasmic adaptor subunit [Acidobacteria bacterium]|nr:efflux RND transporter periplasmic adaptor subunit [Acidobacteriota bacterium]
MLRKNSQAFFTLTLMATGLALAGCSKQQTAGAATTAARPPAHVVVAQARTRDVPIQVRAIGNGEPYSTVTLKPQVTGLVLTVHFKEGQDVKRGDLLFTIDPRPFDVALKQAQAQLEKDKSQLSLAEAQDRRYSKLVEEGVASREQYDQVHATLDALRAAMHADDVAIERAALDLSYCKITSPIDGRAGSLSVYPGNLVKANDVPVLVVLHQVSPIYVSFSVPEQNLAEIKKRMAEGALRVQADVPDGGAPEIGTLAFVDNAVDTSTGTIRLKATFTNAAHRLWPGQFINTLLTLSDQRGAVVIPSAAIQEGQKGTYVFVIKSDNTAESRPITPGRTIDADTVVEKGLAAGETVVIDGQIRLTNGVKVEYSAPVANPK